MDAVLATHVREVELIKSEQNSNCMQAYKKGQINYRNEVLKITKNLEDAKEVQEKLKNNIARLHKDIKQYQDTIKEQEDEIVKLCEPPDMIEMNKVVREVSNFLDDASWKREQEAKILADIGFMLQHEWVPPKEEELPMP